MYLKTKNVALWSKSLESISQLDSELVTWTLACENPVIRVLSTYT